MGQFLISQYQKANAKCIARVSNNMQKFQVTVVCLLVLACYVSASERAGKKSARFRYGYNRHSSGQEYNSERGLKEIALKSASRARAAVNKQWNAGQEAASTAKDNIAKEADQAAETARAALTGKEYAYFKLEKQVQDSQVAVEAEVEQYEIAERSAKAAKEAKDNAERQVKALSEALRKAKSAGVQARAAIEIAISEAASQTYMVDTAREAYRSAYHKLREAKANFEANKQVVDNAEAAAQEAKVNAYTAEILSNLGVSWSSTSESPVETFPRYGFVA